MPNAKYFSKLVATSGFWQIQLDEECSTGLSAAMKWQTCCIWIKSSDHNITEILTVRERATSQCAVFKNSSNTFMDEEFRLKLTTNLYSLYSVNHYLKFQLVNRKWYLLYIVLYLDVSYKPGSTLMVADHLSRSYLNQITEKLFDGFSVNALSYLLMLHRKAILEGWPARRDEIPKFVHIAMTEMNMCAQMV